jgi:hypothetical protein
MICPNCGEPADALVAPGKRNSIDNYDYFCAIGTLAGTDIDGYQVIHK